MPNVTVESNLLASFPLCDCVTANDLSTRTPATQFIDTEGVRFLQETNDESNKDE